MVEFDLQTFLQDMRDETTRGFEALREDHKVGLDSVSLKIDSVANKVNGHETRLVIVENTRKALRWVAMTILAAAMTAAVGLLISLLGK